MNDKELAALSKAYQENRGVIEEVIKRQIIAGRMQKDIARDFGMPYWAISQRARKYGFRYGKKRS